MESSDLSEVVGDGTISESRCTEWFTRFNSDDTSLEDKPRGGRPSDFDGQALFSAMEEDESLITPTVADNFNVDQTNGNQLLKWVVATV